MNKINDYILSNAERTFDGIKTHWESHSVNKSISSFLVLVFIVGISLSYASSKQWIHLGVLQNYFANPFFAIEIVFTLLLIIELLSLVFILPKSVAHAVGKQFELLSLIFIRSGFKEFGRLHQLHWEKIPVELYHMLAFALAALVIFIVMGFNYKLQMHSKLRVNEKDQNEFVQAKKVLALLLLLTFILIGTWDVIHLLKTGIYLHSFDKFYSVLIFSDIIIVLIALRYTLSYYRIFRYSAFVLATIFIRLALTSDIYFNVIIGVLAAVYVLFLTISYNYFLKSLPDPELD